MFLTRKEVSALGALSFPSTLQPSSLPYSLLPVTEVTSPFDVTQTNRHSWCLFSTECGRRPLLEPPAPLRASLEPSQLCCQNCAALSQVFSLQHTVSHVSCLLLVLEVWSQVRGLWLRVHMRVTCGWGFCWEGRGSCSVHGQQVPLCLTGSSRLQGTSLSPRSYNLTLPHSHSWPRDLQAPSLPGMSSRKRPQTWLRFLPLLFALLFLSWLLSPVIAPTFHAL